MTIEIDLAENPGLVWTEFWDALSGGTVKTKYNKIYIQAGEKLAKQIFSERFGIDPENTTCYCCGEDFFIKECPSLEWATAYDRGCYYDKEKRAWEERACDKMDMLSEYITLPEHIKSDTILVIYQAKEKK